jgi:hypothetical protein
MRWWRISNGREWTPEAEQRLGLGLWTCFVMVEFKGAGLQSDENFYLVTRKAERYYTPFIFNI